MMDATVQEAIGDLVERMVAGWNAHDARRFASIFAEDAEFTNVFGVTMAGRRAIEAAHAAIFATMFKDSRLQLTASRSRLLRSDVVVGELRWELTGARDPRGNEWPARRNSMSIVATADDGRWSVASVHNMDLPPEAAIEAARAAMKG
jgi:uncharacterized protein (TIGR02246 family)